VLETEEFKKAYGTLIEDLKLEQYSSMFYPIYLFRRVIYSAMLVILYKYPYAQILIIIVFALIPVFLFL